MTTVMLLFRRGAKEVSRYYPLRDSVKVTNAMRREETVGQAEGKREKAKGKVDRRIKKW